MVLSSTTSSAVVWRIVTELNWSHNWVILWMPFWSICAVSSTIFSSGKYNNHFINEITYTSEWVWLHRFVVDEWYRQSSTYDRVLNISHLKQIQILTLLIANRYFYSIWEYREHLMNVKSMLMPFLLLISFLLSLTLSHQSTNFHWKSSSYSIYFKLINHFIIR